MAEKKVIAKNKKAFHDFEILEKLEVGLVLKGCEVKSIRAGHVSIKESYARILRDELWLLGCHINPYPQASGEQPHPERDRKLLVHKSELRKWMKRVDEKGCTIVPLQLYIFKRHVKLELGLGKAKKMYDKRRSLKDRETRRELDRATKNRH